MLIDAPRDSEGVQRGGLERVRRGFGGGQRRAKRAPRRGAASQLWPAKPAFLRVSVKCPKNPFLSFNASTTLEMIGNNEKIKNS